MTGLIKLLNRASDKGGLKSALYLMTISLVFFILSATNFAEANIDFTRLQDSKFWFDYMVTIGLALLILVLSIPYKKDKNMRKGKIQDSLEEIRSLKVYITEKGYYDDFKIHLSKLNEKRKLAKYKAYLNYKKDKAKKDIIIDKYDSLIEEANQDDFDITAIKAKWWLYLRMKFVNVNTIFSGFNTSEEDNKVHYTGLEGLLSRILPVILAGVIMQALMLAVAMSFKDGRELDQWILLATRIWIMLSYLNVGFSFADYSITTVYYEVLENRKTEVRTFLEKKGISIVIKENETYKYKIEEKEVFSNDIQS